jgi:hypothetical protein
MLASIQGANEKISNPFSHMAHQACEVDCHFHLTFLLEQANIEEKYLGEVCIFQLVFFFEVSKYSSAVTNMS